MARDPSCIDRESLATRVLWNERHGAAERLKYATQRYKDPLMATCDGVVEKEGFILPVYLFGSTCKAEKLRGSVRGRREGNSRRDTFSPCAHAVADADLR